MHNDVADKIRTNYSTHGQPLIAWSQSFYSKDNMKDSNY